MEKLNNIDDQKSKSDAYIRAKKRVESLRGFYIHLAVYIVINSFITLRNIFEYVENGFTVKDAFSDGDTYTLWIIWGLGLLIHGINVFTYASIFGQNWEEKKIQKYMDEDARTWK